MTPTPGRYHWSNMRELRTQFLTDEIEPDELRQAVIGEVPDGVDEFYITVERVPGGKYYDVYVKWVSP